MDLVIKNGLVVSPLSTTRADVGIRKGKIAAIAEDLEVSPEVRVVDAAGKYLLPGIIDVHTHMEHWSGPQRTADDFATGTRAAACGGVTTIIDFAIQRKGETLVETVSARRAVADPKVAIDYGLHPCLTSVTTETPDMVRQLVSEGYPSFKVFMTFRKEGFMVEDGALYALLQEASECGALIGVHAENTGILEHLIEQCLRENRTSPEYYAGSRPHLVETESISRAIMFAEEAGSPLYIFHMSTAQGTDIVRAARSRGTRVLAETCPHYLVLTEDKYRRPDGHTLIMSPPLRRQKDSDSLWEGLRRGDVDIISSDHCGFTLEQKEPGRKSFAAVAPGIPGVETLLPVVYTEGVASGRISVNKLVEALCHNPAEIFGLPQKGAIEVGKDADIVILDPDREVTLSGSELNMASRYTPFEGLRAKGYPDLTILRGQVVSERGRFIGRAGFGKFVPRKIS